MSGTFRPVEVPDLGATLARMAQIDAQRQSLDIQRQAAKQEQGFNQGLAELAPALASGQGPEYSAALSRLVGLGPRGAAMGLPMLQQERQRAEAADFWRTGGGNNPTVVPNSVVPAGDYTARMVAMESGGDPNARNPRSTATGQGQFIDGTWMEFARANPELFQGMNPQQILAARSNPDLSRRAIEWYRQSNAQNLAAQGLPANDGAAALAHRFGPQGAAALLRADPNAPIDGVVGPQVMRANPDLAGRTVGQVVDGYAQRFGGGAATPAALQQPGGVNPAELALLERAMTHSNPQVQQQAQRRLEILRMRQQNNPEQYVAATEMIGGRQVQGQRNTRTGQFTPFPGQTGAEQSGPFGGNGMEAQANNIVLSLAEKIRTGAATPQEQALYQRAYFHLSEGSVQFIPDPSDPTGQRQVAVRVPRNMGDLPAPTSGGGAPATVPTQAAPTAPLAAGLVAPAQAMPGNDAVPAPSVPGAIPGMERMTPPPAGFQRRADGQPGFEPVPGGPQDPNQNSAGDRTRLRQIETDAQGIFDALNNFRQTRRGAGVLERGFTALGVPTELATSWANAALLAKGEALYNLGVLNGPDLTIIQRVLADPSTIRGFFTGSETAEAQIRQIETLLQQRVAAARQQYGAGMQRPQSPGPGGRGVAEPPPSAQPSRDPVRVNTPEEAQRLAPGTPYITPQGQRYTR